MAFNENIQYDPRSFMYYNGQYYINGTVVELLDSYTQNNNFQGKKIWKYARFDRQIRINGKVSYFFCIAKFDSISLMEMGLDLSIQKEYAYYFTIDAYMLEFAIKQIIKPICLTKTEQATIDISLENMIEHPKKDLDCEELRIGWFIYFIVIVASLIFKQFYIIWIVVSLLFFKWRKGVLKQ